MRRKTWHNIVLGAICGLLAGCGAGQTAAWQDTFDLKKCTLLTIGKNDYWILQPGHQVVIAKEEVGDAEQVIITVLHKTKMVDGVKTRIVEEKEYLNGKLKEISRNFFTICKEHNDVFYHGEEVDDFKDGKIVGHGGAWLAGVKGARAGLMMPGKIKIGMRHYQEVAPGVAMDRATILRNDLVFESPLGKLKDCLKVVETSPLEPNTKSYKVYAPGIGLIVDGDLVLVQYGEGKSSPTGPVKLGAGATKVYTEVELTGNVPAAVSAVFAKLYPKGEIREVKKEMHPDGREFYAAEIFVGDQQYDVEVTEDGTVLSNKAE